MINLYNKAMQGLLNRIVRRLSILGVQSDYDEDLNNRIILANRIMLVCIANTLPFAPLFWVWGITSLSIGILIISAAYTSCLILNAFKKHRMARFCTCLYPVIAISAYFSVSGTAAGFHYILFFCAALPHLLWTKKHTKTIHSFMALPIMLFVVFEFYGPKFVWTNIFPATVLPVLKFLSICVTFICALGSIGIYVNQTVQLLDKKRMIVAQNRKKLDDLIIEIRNKNKIIDDFTPKDAFIKLTKGVAHEIKSPMACLLAGAELMNLQKDDPTAIQEFSELMITTIKRLSKLTESMLSFSGSMASESQDFSVNKMIQELEVLCKSHCESKSINMIIKLEDSLSIHADRVFVAQALLNLVMNGIQYTPKNGTITISSKEKKQMVQLIVQDNGTGIEESRIETLFEPQISTQKESHNAGLGLALVKRVATENKGQVWVDSKVGKGSCFVVELPKASTRKSA